MLVPLANFLAGSIIGAQSEAEKSVHFLDNIVIDIYVIY